MASKIVKVRDLVSRSVSGGTPSRQHSEYFSGTIPWVTSVGLHTREVHLNDGKEYITEKAVSNSACNVVTEPCVLVALRVGVANVAYSNIPISFSQDVIALVYDNTKVFGDYLMHAISASKKKLISKARG